MNLRHEGLNPHERFLARVLEVICAACIGATIIAAVQDQMWWAFLFVACAYGCFEASGELDR